MPVAIMDIGSNAVRFVIFDAADRAPVKIHNERVQCHLGKGLAKTGYLNPAGVVLAFEAIGRFAGLAKAMNIRSVHALATAAMRDAKDGKDFIASVKKAFGLSIRIIDGEEEARLSAQGVLMNALDAKGASGIIGDYGGGSLELIAVKNGRMRDKISLPIGAHRLQAIEGRTARMKAVEAMLKPASFLKAHQGLDFYAIGGAWRSIGKAHMTLAQHPLPVLDQYAIAGKTAEAFAAMLSKQSTAQLQKKLGGMEKRLHDIDVAALAMERVLRLLNPAHVVFSGTGLREGMLYDRLSLTQKSEDALIASAMKIARRNADAGKTAAYETLSDFIMPLFKTKNKDVRRLVQAATLLSDICRYEHEDVQATQAMQRALLSPLYGIDHAGRAFLATALAVRYGAKPHIPALEKLRALMDAQTQKTAVATGLALHLAQMLSGGRPALLKNAHVRLTTKIVKLELTGVMRAVQAENVDKAVDVLAETLGRRGEVVFF